MAKCLNINRAFHSSKTFNQLTLVDVMCPVCRGIFIEPVTLPCRHGLCLKCFERAMDETSLTCPMCRKRVGGWLRTATKGGKIVNDQLWNYIKARFPDQVQKKLKGEDDGVEEQVVTASTPAVRLSSPGEIRREYELQVKRLEEEARRREEKEKKASEELILKLSEEEREIQQRLLNQAKEDEEIARRLFEQEMAREREKQEEAERQKRDQEIARQLEEEAWLLLEKEKAQELQDEQIARQLQEQDVQSTSKSGTTDKENKTEEPPPISPRTPVSVVKGPMDSFVSFGRSRRSSKLEPSTAALPRKGPSVPEVEKVRSSSNMSCSSHDSINQEMHHFKPIKVMPRTPPKRLPDGQVVEPKLIRSTPRNLNKILELETPKSKTVSRFHQQRLLHQSKRTSLPASSAFKGLLSARNESERTMISPESVTMASRQVRSDEDSTSFGLFEVPDVTTPPLSPLPALSSELSLASASTPGEIPSVPAAYDADLFYNPEVPVCIDYGQSEKAACTITEADESVDYVTEADASLGYETELDMTVTEEGTSSSSSSSSSASSSKINNNNNNNTVATAKEDEQQSAVQPTSLQAILRLTKIVEKNLHWELARQHQQLSDEELARQLQEQWEAEDMLINRSRDSDNPYSLRNGTRKKTEKSYATPTKKKTACGKVSKNRMMQNQKTIKEAFARTRATTK